MDKNTVSYWNKTAEEAFYPRLTKSMDTEALIIGGGITGVTCAYCLGIRGISSVLIEAGRPLRRHDRKHNGESDSAARCCLFGPYQKARTGCGAGTMPSLNQTQWLSSGIRFGTKKSTAS